MRGFSLALMVVLLPQVGCEEAQVRREVNKAVVRQWVQALNENQIDSLDAIVVEDFVRHSQATPDVKVNSLAEFKRFDRETRETFPDYELKIEQLVAEDDKVAFWGTFSGAQTGRMGAWPATGEELELDISGIFRFEEGRIAELWITWDNLAGLSQLGLAPTPGEMTVPDTSEAETAEGS